MFQKRLLSLKILFIIKEKLSQIVSSQFPEFVQSDHQKFIAFFEAYYKFLEQDQNPQEIIQNILAYH